MLTLALGISLSGQAQNVPSFVNPPQFVSNCEGLQFCVINPPLGTHFYRIRSIGGANQELTTTTDPCWTLTIPATQVRATFLDINMNVLPIPGTSRDYIGVSTPNLPPPTITVGNGSFFTNICTRRVSFVNLNINTCVDPGSWEILGQPGNGVQVSLEPGGNGNFVSTKVLRVDATNATAGFASFTIRATAGITGPVTRTVVLRLFNCGFFSGDGTTQDLLFAAGVDLEDPTSEEAAKLIKQLNAKPLSGNVSAEIGLSVFPNPVGSLLTVKYDAQPEELRLIDINGRTVRAVNGAKLGDVSTRIDVNDLATGIYLLETISKQGERNVTKVQVNR